jgi:hypothetical protein
MPELSIAEARAFSAEVPIRLPIKPAMTRDDARDLLRRVTALRDAGATVEEHGGFFDLAGQGFDPRSPEPVVDKRTRRKGLAHYLPLIGQSTQRKMSLRVFDSDELWAYDCTVGYNDWLLPLLDIHRGLVKSVSRRLSVEHVPTKESEVCVTFTIESLSEPSGKKETSGRVVLAVTGKSQEQTLFTGTLEVQIAGGFSE